MDSVTTEVVAAVPVLSLLRYVRAGELDDAIDAGIAALRQCADQHSLSQTGAPLGVYHGMVTDDQNGPIEICLPVDRLVPLAGDTRAVQLSGGQLAQVTVRGAETDFPAILAAYDAVASWIDAQGHRPVGPPRESWLTSPGDGSTPVMQVSSPYA